MFKKISLFLFLALFLTVFVPEVLPSTAPSAHANQVPVPGENIDSGGFMYNLDSITHPGIETTVRQGWIRRGVNYFFENIIGFMAAVIGTLAILMISVGGFLMLSSAGNEQMYEQGKNYVKFALIGLAFTLSAYLLVTLVQLLIQSIYA